MSQWSDKEKELVVKSKKENKTYEQIASILSSFGFKRTAESIRKWFKRNIKEIDVVGEVISAATETFNETFIDQKLVVPPVLDKEDLGLTSKTLVEDFYQLKNMLIEEKELLPKKPSDEQVKVLTISDLHIMFMYEKLFWQMINDHLDADVLVLNGDLMDQYATSFFPKNKIVPIYEEMIKFGKILEILNELFVVIITEGNHCVRIKKYFTDLISPHLSMFYDSDVVEMVARGIVPAMEKISPDDYNGDNEQFVKSHKKYTLKMEKKYDLEHVYVGGAFIKWFVKIGRAIFAHPSAYSKVQLQTVRRLHTHLLEGGRHDYDVVVIGHTHSWGSAMVGDKMIVEQGCCCLPMDYEAGPRLRMKPSQTFGCAVVYLNEDGSVDLTKSGPKYYGSVSAYRDSNIQEYTMDDLKEMISKRKGK